MRHDMYGKVGASGKACERLFDQCPVIKSVKKQIVTSNVAARSKYLT